MLYTLFENSYVNSTHSERQGRVEDTLVRSVGKTSMTCSNGVMVSRTAAQALPRRGAVCSRSLAVLAIHQARRRETARVDHNHPIIHHAEEGWQERREEGQERAHRLGRDAAREVGRGGGPQRSLDIHEVHRASVDDHKNCACTQPNCWNRRFFLLPSVVPFVLFGHPLVKIYFLGSACSRLTHARRASWSI